ncbi:hypothetical protein [Halapricum hydrolyticum]|uniref:Uncharacterized protein n=1 Tax=Halapricum hydrolyticum TaxID=2979991 RepID=A0AAE3I8B4_9EURY|nr:hypothetical protein [Halapricum hydrolyticum]MCU4716877.1 hypothetical protein [Halapricum hydrolyticum]MCU4725518.1 hypothetical protein [Halapricum hydrolyticum]
MVNDNTFSVLLQVVALFLPAWAIMVQIFARLMEDSDIDENPSLIPFFGVGLALTIVSIWLFGRAVIGAALSHMIQQAEANEANQLLFEGLLDAIQGELAFTFLGLVVLIIAGIRYFKQWNGAHVLGVVLFSIFAMKLGIEYGSIVTVAAILFILIIADLLFCWTFWPGLREQLRKREPFLDRLMKG